MKRLHVHLSVPSLEEGVRFYSALFGAEPSVLKSDYAKWMVEDPRVNFAISTRSADKGLDHLGIQVEDDTELQEVHARLAAAAMPVVEQEGTACCYARSDKYWTVDPQGIAWEAFHSLEQIPVFGDGEEAQDKEAAGSACCAPALQSADKGCCA